MTDVSEAAGWARDLDELADEAELTTGGELG
jgi:hypothetical protein